MGQLPRGTRQFPLFVLFNPDGSAKPAYEPLRRDRRPIVVLPANMMNRPLKRAASSSASYAVNGTAIFPQKFYQITMNGVATTVPGRYIRQRKSRPGAFSIKINRQRRAIRGNYRIVEVSSMAAGGYGHHGMC